MQDPYNSLNRSGILERRTSHPQLGKLETSESRYWRILRPGKPQDARAEQGLFEQIGLLVEYDSSDGTITALSSESLNAWRSSSSAGFLRLALALTASHLWIKKL